jgi:hypothetical protein
MIVIDENIIESQRQMLIRRNVRVRQIGFEIGHKGMTIGNNSSHSCIACGVPHCSHAISASISARSVTSATALLCLQLSTKRLRS